MRYFEITQAKTSKPKAAPKTDAVSQRDPKTVRIAPGTGAVRVRAKGRIAYIVNDGVANWCPSSKPDRMD